MLNKMRNLTKEEQESLCKRLSDMSEYTGIDLFDYSYKDEINARSCFECEYYRRDWNKQRYCDKYNVLLGSIGQPIMKYCNLIKNGISIDPFGGK